MINAAVSIWLEPRRILWHYATTQEYSRLNDGKAAIRLRLGDPSRASALVVHARDVLAKANLEDESDCKRWESNNKILTRLLAELRST